MRSQTELIADHCQKNFSILKSDDILTHEKDVKLYRSDSNLASDILLKYRFPRKRFNETKNAKTSKCPHAASSNP